MGVLIDKNSTMLILRIAYIINNFIPAENEDPALPAPPAPLLHRQAAIDALETLPPILPAD